MCSVLLLENLSVSLFPTGEQTEKLRQKPQQPANPRVLKVAIIGTPNAGKSTLANQLLGWRVRPEAMNQ